jgi:FkbM family methyltransferase
METVNPAIKRLIKFPFQLVGLDLSRIQYCETVKKDSRFEIAPGNEHKWLQDMEIKTVLDVGACNGESALRFHHLFPDAHVYSFEPVRDFFENLKANLKSIANQTSFNIALGDKKEQSSINHNDYSQSSSILKMGKLHKEAFPFTSREFSETIEIDTLDNLAGEMRLERNVLLKIDTQGYEQKVLTGGLNTLRQIHIVIVEVSLLELYVDQPLFHDIYEILKYSGFDYVGCWLQLHDPRNGTPLQQDAIFLRRNNVGS